MDPLLSALSSWRPFTALVVGDFMLDQQVYGDAERLSADAPVPILHVRRRTDNPGGAANVCLDLIALRARVEAFGITGDDATGALLRQSLESQGVSVAGLIADPTGGRPTTVKQNLIGLAQTRHPQKMFRVDIESREPIPAALVERLLAAFRAALPRADVVCIEDYNKGVCTEAVCQGVIRAAQVAGKPVFVDPARIPDYAKYRGATVLTPNRSEAEFSTGLRTHEGDASDAEAGGHNARLAHSLLQHVDLDAIVLTLDRHGALLVERGQQPLAIPTIARQVYDVTGAGDMFLAALAAARANSLAWPDAVRLANAAAGLEVEIFGIQPIPLERLHHAVLEQSTKTAGKLRTLDQLLVEVKARRARGESIVFTNGCFDILHPGHITLLEKAAAAASPPAAGGVAEARRGDGGGVSHPPDCFLIVAINTDESVRRLKGDGRPINTESDRARVLGALGCVGAVVFFNDETPIKLIEAIKPDILVKGADYRKDQVVGGDYVEKHGGRVVLIDLVEGKSTTGTIAKLRRG